MTDQNKVLAGKLALVTGASRGIGAATAMALAEKGAHVVITARAAKELEAVEEAIFDAGGSATGPWLHPAASKLLWSARGSPRSHEQANGLGEASGSRHCDLMPREFTDKVNRPPPAKISAGRRDFLRSGP